MLRCEARCGGPEGYHSRSMGPILSVLAAEKEAMPGGGALVAAHVVGEASGGDRKFRPLWAWH